MICIVNIAGINKLQQADRFMQIIYSYIGRNIAMLRGIYIAASIWLLIYMPILAISSYFNLLTLLRANK